MKINWSAVKSNLTNLEVHVKILLTTAYGAAAGAVISMLNDPAKIMHMAHSDWIRMRDVAAGTAVIAVANHVRKSPLIDSSAK